MSETILKLVGGKVREIRKAHGLSQEELGEQAGFHYSYIGGLERGERNVSLANLGKIAETLHVEVYDLFGYVREYDKPLTGKDKALKEAFLLLLNKDEKEIQMAIKVLTEIFQSYGNK